MGKCPDCGKSMKAASIKRHRVNLHGKSGSPASTSSSPSDDTSFSGQIGKALDPSFDFGVTDVTHQNSRSRSGIIRILPNGESQPVTVFRATGVPVVRKIGDKTRYPVEWDQ